MFHESNKVSTIENVRNLAQNAGFRKLTPLQETLLPQVTDGKNLFVNTSKQKGKTLAALLSVLSRMPEKGKASKALIITPESRDISKMGSLAENMISSNRLPFIATTLTNGGDPKRELQELSRNPDIIIGSTDRIIDHIRKKNLHMDKTTIATVFITKDVIPPGFDKNLFFIFSKLPKKVQTVFFSPEEKLSSIFEEISRKPLHLTISDPDNRKEKSMTPQKTDSNNNNDDFIAQKLKELIALIKSDKNPKELEKYRKLIRKNVPMTMRSYVGAYLFRALIDDSPTPKAGRKNTSSENHITLFLSIGKNRRVFPKDITRFICSSLDIDPSNLGTIKILDSYSFVDIHRDHADAAVNTLNEKEYRGRKLTVNYARKR